MNFRVTDEELERLRDASSRNGARCLSDFARWLMFSHPNLQPLTLLGSHDERFIYLDRRLTAVERSISRLTDALAGPPPESVRS